MSKKDTEKETAKKVEETAGQKPEKAADQKPEKKAEEKPEQKAEAEKEQKTKKKAEQTAETEPEQSPPEKEEDDLRGQLEKTSAQLAAQKDLFLRTAAEYDNYRKRTDREKTSLYADTIAEAVAKFLPVYDNLQRALSQPDCSLEDLRKGVEMVEKQMGETLEKFGVSAVGETGDPFDPAVHNAVSHVEDENLGENVVAAVLQKGYRLGGRIIRHAMVQVAN